MFTDDKKGVKLKLNQDQNVSSYGLNFEKGKILFEVFIGRLVLSFVFFKASQIICRQTGLARKQDLSEAQHIFDEIQFVNHF